jgi:hypothetical protein
MLRWVEYLVVATGSIAGVLAVLMSVVATLGFPLAVVGAFMGALLATACVCWLGGLHMAWTYFSIRPDVDLVVPDDPATSPGWFSWDRETIQFPMAAVIAAQDLPANRVETAVTKRARARIELIRVAAQANRRREDRETTLFDRDVADRDKTSVVDRADLGGGARHATGDAIGCARLLVGPHRSFGIGGQSEDRTIDRGVHMAQISVGVGDLYGENKDDIPVVFTEVPFPGIATAIDDRVPHRRWHVRLS